MNWDEQVNMETSTSSSTKNIEQDRQPSSTELEGSYRKSETNDSNNEESDNLQELQINKNTREDKQKIYTTRDSTNQEKGAEITKKTWSSLFAKLKKGQSTYSSFSPRNSIKSKNDNALVFEISDLTHSFNEIMISLYEYAGQDIIAAKQHFNKGVRTHLEVVFDDKERLKHYATKGITIFNQTYYGFIPVDNRRSFLSIKVRNVPLNNKNKVSNALLEVFEDIGKVVSIKPLLIEGTPYATDQWIVVFETTDDPELESRIPRFYLLWDNKITTEWRSAPRMCFFCDKEGHFKKDCSQYKEAIELKQQYKKFQNNKKKTTSTPAYNNLEETTSVETTKSDLTSQTQTSISQEREVIAVTVVQSEDLTSSLTSFSMEMDKAENFATSCTEVQMVDTDSSSINFLQPKDSMTTEHIDQTSNTNDSENEFTLVTDRKRKRKPKRNDNQEPKEAKSPFKDKTNLDPNQRNSQNNPNLKK